MGHQTLVWFNTPDFFPPLDFFYGLFHSDIWIVVDHVTYGVRTRNNRCRIKKQTGIDVLSVSVKHPCNKPICSTMIDNNQPWKRLFLESLKRDYINAPFFGEYYYLIKNQIQSPNVLLETLNVQSTMAIMNLLGKNPKILYTKDYCSLYSDDQLQPQICKNLDAEPFNKPFIHPKYQQLWDPFEQGLSVIDCLMCTGTEELKRFLA